MQVPTPQADARELRRVRAAAQSARERRRAATADPRVYLAFWPLCLFLSGLKMGIEHGIVASAKWRCQCKSQHHKLMRENCGVRAAQSA